MKLLPAILSALLFFSGTEEKQKPPTTTDLFNRSFYLSKNRSDFAVSLSSPTPQNTCELQIHQEFTENGCVYGILTQGYLPKERLDSLAQLTDKYSFSKQSFDSANVILVARNVTDDYSIGIADFPLGETLDAYIEQENIQLVLNAKQLKTANNIFDTIAPVIYSYIGPQSSTTQNITPAILQKHKRYLNK